MRMFSSPKPFFLSSSGLPDLTWLAYLRLRQDFQAAGAGRTERRSHSQPVGAGSDIGLPLSSHGSGRADMQPLPGHQENATETSCSRQRSLLVVDSLSRLQRPVPRRRPSCGGRQRKPVNVHVDCDPSGPPASCGAASAAAATGGSAPAQLFTEQVADK